MNHQPNRHVRSCGCDLPPKADVEPTVNDNLLAEATAASNKPDRKVDSIETRSSVIDGKLTFVFQPVTNS